MSLLAPTLARLEQFSYLSYEESLVGDFGPNCTRVCLNLYFEEDRTQWHTVNGEWLANVTHLKLTTVSELDRLIEYFSQHAVSLQVLYLEGRNYTRMNSQMVGHLSKLENLYELELSYILVDLPQLKEAARMFQLVPLDPIRTFTLSPCNFVALKDGNQLTSILCTILPNVEHLNLSCNFFNFKLETFEKYLHRFTKLRSHSF